MKQLLILSGKGGTGKTTIASAFVKLSQAQAYADCDVDAPNLHLTTQQHNKPKQQDYYGMPKAQIDTTLCIKCDQCRQHCAFDAIGVEKSYQVIPFACEGCGVCEYICPVNAISMESSIDGDLMLYLKKDEVFSTAQLKMGSGTSGMLVAEVKKQMKEAANNPELAIIDGSPGIGCPVIASLSGVDMVLIVAEPSISGISDMQRIVITARKFGITPMICVNKYDTNIENTTQIEDFCKKENLLFIGKIPFDSLAVQSINNGRSIIEIHCPSGRAVKKIYYKIMGLLCNEK